MNSRERFLKIFEFEKPDKIPWWELGFWGETLTRWWDEGLPEGTIPQDHFELESWYTVAGIGISMTPEEWRMHQGMGKDRRFYEFMDFNLVDYSPGYEEKIIEETSAYVTYQDAQGMVKKELKETESMTQFLKNPVETPDDFREYRARFDPKDEHRYYPGFEKHLQEKYDSGDIICLNIPGFYWQARWMLGPEKTLFNFAAEPELIGEFMEFWGDFQIENSRRLLECGVPVDLSVIVEDVAYKGGSLISLDHFKEFMLPQYKRVTRFFKKKGVGTILVDSDGEITDLIPLFIEGGVDGMLPFEVAAGMDVRKVRKDHPGFILMGGIDKRLMASGGDALKAELEGKLQLVGDGGYIPGCDHGVPADVSFSKYKEYLELKDHIAADVLND